MNRMMSSGGTRIPNSSSTTLSNVTVARESQSSTDPRLALGMLSGSKYANAAEKQLASLVWMSLIIEEGPGHGGAAVGIERRRSLSGVGSRLGAGYRSGRRRNRAGVHS